MLSLRTISTGLSVTFTSSSGRKREIIEKESYERIPYQMERRDDCRIAFERGLRTEVNLKTHEESFYKTREAIEM